MLVLGGWGGGSVALEGPWLRPLHPFHTFVDEIPCCCSSWWTNSPSDMTVVSTVTEKAMGGAKLA